MADEISLMRLRESSVRVVHFHGRFGALSENWISNQIDGLDGEVVGIYSLEEAVGDINACGSVRCVRRDVKGVSRLLDRALRRFIHRCPQCLLWLMKDRANIVHAHFGRHGNYIWPFARLLGIPLVTSFYGYDAYRLPYQTPYPTRYYKKLFRFGRLFLVEGSAMRDKLIELGCPAEKIVIHHIGIDVTRTKFSPRTMGEIVRLLVCGRFVEKKGIPFSVEALRLAREATGRDIRLTVVGDSDKQGTMTAEKQTILAAVKDYRLDDIVSFAGFVSRERLPGLLQNHDILVVPSIHAADGDAEGGFPVIITEALAGGMPVVGFSHCDIPEIVRDGESGFLVPEGDVNALAEKVMYLVEHPDIWRELGCAGRAHVEANYSLEKLNNRLAEVYQRLLQDNGAEGGL